MDPIFRVDGNRVVTSPDAAGPWDPRMQHGSAPAALVVWAAEAIPTPVPMQIARVTIDLMRPVPVAPLTIESDVLREGRKIQLCAIKLLAGGIGTGNDAIAVHAKNGVHQINSGSRCLRFPDAAQRVSGALLSRGPSLRVEVGPGSAAHRQRGAAPRPGHDITP